MWDSLPPGLAEHFVNKSGRWIPNLRLVCQNWRHGVDDLVKHVQLDGEAFRNTNTTIQEGITRIKETFPNLESLSCENGGGDWLEAVSMTFQGRLMALSLDCDSHQSWACFSNLTNLRSLRLWRDVRTHVDLGGLSSLPFLTKLDLEDCAIGTDCIEEVGHLTQLRKLNLGGNYAMRGIKFLESLTKLEELIFSGRRLYGVSCVSQLTNLTKLAMRSVNLDDTDASCLSILLSLDDLELDHVEISRVGLDYLYHLVGLSRLSLNMPSLDFQWMTYFHDLKCLRMKSQSNEVMDMNPILHFTCLETLELYNIAINNEGLLALTQLGKLRQLRLEVDKITNGVFAMLGNLISLETLFLGRRIERRKSLKDWGHFPKVRRLHIYGYGWGDGSLVHLSRLMQLDSLELRQTDCSDCAVGYLTQLNGLTRLGVWNPPRRGPFMSQQVGVSCLATFEFSKLSNLMELQLRGRWFSPQHNADLREVMPYCTISDKLDGEWHLDCF